MQEQEIDKKSLAVILDAIRHARETICQLACDNSPYTSSRNADLREMYFDLAGMQIKVYDMLKAKKMEEEGLLHEENAQDG